ncbi:alpha-ketoglutarate-dependent dioxygenase AlkB [Sphingomonas abietis]|uniref:Alpha-ketoglutarate-dependent dioxygenase AlkB n=1 Tax=Sphingomonas abietis TaxID=3012344 RepID=A0ABY7NKR9_9SPHN|nr:alpha-ketoglutarate-dependent dioxygenase AlkB [Sphingomonas abietis]WBO21842.1 alpha-ketoglutarate-dependent dioxygenase AlkB [Sphingomonas abietis]
MLDLFNAPLLPGLASFPEIVSDDEERGLISAIDAIELSPFRFQGWTGKRVTASFGWNYDFDTHRVDRAAPIPPWLQPVRERLARCAGLDPRELIQALMIRYDKGAGINWHRDRPIYEHVVGLSLGAPADMRFRRQRPDGKYDRVSLPLAPRAAYHMSGEARHEWQHSINEMDRTRWSITFRSPSSLWPRD